MTRFEERLDFEKKFGKEPTHDANEARLWRAMFEGWYAHAQQQERVTHG